MTAMGHAITKAETAAEAAIAAVPDWVGLDVTYRDRTVAVMSPMHKGVDSWCFSVAPCHPRGPGDRVRGVPGHIRSDNGPEFIAKLVREWIVAVGARTAYIEIEPGSPWENGYCESFNSKLRDELLNGEIFYSLSEAKVIIESWRCHYNTIRPHSSLAYRPPSPKAVAWPATQPGPASPATPALALRPTMN